VRHFLRDSSDKHGLTVKGRFNVSSAGGAPFIIKLIVLSIVTASTGQPDKLNTGNPARERHSGLNTPPGLSRLN
jgi:hypothetical protein